MLFDGKNAALLFIFGENPAWVILWRQSLNIIYDNTSQCLYNVAPRVMHFSAFIANMGQLCWTDRPRLFVVVYKPIERCPGLPFHFPVIL